MSHQFVGYSITPDDIVFDFQYETFFPHSPSRKEAKRGTLMMIRMVVQVTRKGENKKIIR